MTHGCGLKPTNESMDRVLGDLKAGTSRSAGCQPCHVGQSNRWDGKNQRRTTSPGGTSVDEPGTYSGTGSQCHAMRPTDRLLQPALAGFMGSARVFTPGRRRGPGRRVRNRCIRTQGSRCNATLPRFPIFTGSLESGGQTAICPYVGFRFFAYPTSRLLASFNFAPPRPEPGPPGDRASAPFCHLVLPSRPISPARSLSYLRLAGTLRTTPRTNHQITEGLRSCRPLDDSHYAISCH
jgi:hypothetical protein